MMLLACPRCGEQTPGDARFCITCGAVLNPRPPRATQRPASAIGPTLRLGRNGATSGRGAVSPRDGIPMIGLLFGVLFLIGFAQILASGGMRDLGPWTVGALVGGALLAECAWVNGEIWVGLRGMILWGGLTGLLAVGRVFPWGLLLIPIWLMLWLHTHGRRP